MDQKGLEAVLISTETSTHADLAKKAMERGLVSALCFISHTFHNSTDPTLLGRCP